MYFARRSLIPLLLIGILLSSCGGQIAAGEPTPDINATVAAAAETLAAALFQTQTALAPTITNTAFPSCLSHPAGSLLCITRTDRDLLYPDSKLLSAGGWM
jgi:hypothetical protein